MVHLLHIEKFTIQSYKDPHVHLKNVLEICAIFIPMGVSTDYIRLTQFSFLLLREERKCVNAEPIASITTWHDPFLKFLIYFFP